MKQLIAVLLCLPMFVGAQKIRINEFDKFIKQQRIESAPLSVSTASHMKMAVALSAVGSKLYLQLIGAGLGANRIDAEDKVIFLLENDSTVVLKSKGYQGFDVGVTLSTYKHHYLLSYADLQMLSRHNLQALRKYRSEDYDDVQVSKEASNQLKQLCALFADELVKSNLVPSNLAVADAQPKTDTGLVNTSIDTAFAVKDVVKPVVPEAIAPAFPGGADVWFSFLRRNLVPPEDLKAGEIKEVKVQFMVLADGSVMDIKIIQSPGVAYDKEVLRVLNRMPKWKAAIERGYPVDARVTQSITFQPKEMAGIL